MKNKSRMLVVSSLLAVLLLTAVAVIRAQQSAAVQMAPSSEGVAGGKALTLVVRLDKPLPPDQTVIARVSAEAVSQTIQLSSTTPDDSTRTKFTLKTVLPAPIVPGKWILQSVFITLPGSTSWQGIEHNPLTFDVQGQPFPIPSKAEVTVGH